MWAWVLDAAISLLGLALIVAASSTTTAARIEWLWRRAQLCALGATLGALTLGVVSAIRLVRALRGTSADPSQAARVMASNISGAFDGFGAALLLLPLPLIATLVIWRRRRTLTAR
jgi:hypothetical protein